MEVTSGKEKKYNIGFYKVVCKTSTFNLQEQIYNLKHLIIRV